MDLIIGGQIMSNIVNLDFIEEVKELLSKAKEHVKTTINVAMVYTYYEIGRRIVEQEQKGQNRAEYGKEVIKQLSLALSKEFGKGYSIQNLFLIRKFYLIYSSAQIFQSPIRKCEYLPVSSEGRRFYLSWTHYVKLINITSEYERNFYEIESFNNNWSVRELQRQIASCLFERLAV